MTTLRVANNTAAPVTIQDVGVVIPASSFVDYTDQALLRDLANSKNLRTLVTATTLSISDTVNPLTFDDLAAYFSFGGQQMTVKGSIPIPTATGMKALVPGANGSVLMADSTTPEGVKYAPSGSVVDPRDIFRFSMIHNVGVTGGG